MAAPLLDAKNLNDLLGSLFEPGALIELAVLAGCLVLAWALVRRIRGAEAPEDSIWFGQRIVDGVLFPILALALATGARLALHATAHAAVFRLALPILVSLVVIRLSVRVLGATFPDARWVRVLERSISWLAWIAVVLWITGVLPILMDAMDDVQWRIGTARMSLRNVVEGLLSTGLVMVIALWVSSVIEKKLLHGSGSSLSLRKIAASLVRVLLLFIGLLVALSAVGIDLTALSVLGGALGVGIGLGLQRIAANYISGFVVLLERKVRLGDVVRIDSVQGKVRDIRTRYTLIEAGNGALHVMPNELLITATVQNLTITGRMRLTLPVQVAYDTDLDQAVRLAVEAASVTPRVLAAPAPAVVLTRFDPDGINLELSFSIGDPNAGQGNVISEVARELWRRYQQAGIRVPGPRREVTVTHAEPSASPAGTPAGQEA